MKLRIILFLVICSTFSLAQVPEDVDTGAIQKIDQEHKATRKFMSDELTRQRTEFFKQIDDRATYYENTVERLLSKTVLYLGLLWAGIVILAVGISNYTRLRLERTRFDRMMRAIRQQIAVAPVANTQTDIQKEFPTMTKDFNQNNKEFGIQGQSLIKEKKLSWSERRREKQIEKEKKSIEKQKSRIAEQENKLYGKPKDKTEKEHNLSYDFEVQYGR